MKFEQIVNFSKDWYDFGNYKLPDFGTNEFARVAGKGQEFVHILIGRETNYSLRVTNVPTACVNLDTNEIEISAQYFQPQFFQERFGASVENLSELSIAMVNGSIIHEALHILYTEETPYNIAQNYKSSSPAQAALLKEALETFGASAVFRAFNIVEDIYIENQLEFNKPLFSWIRAVQSIMFDPNEFDDLNDGTLNGYLNVLTAWKNHDERNHPVFAKALSKNILWILKSNARGYCSIKERFGFALEILFDLLRSNPSMKLPELSDEEKSMEGKGGKSAPRAELENDDNKNKEVDEKIVDVIDKLVNESSNEEMKRQSTRITFSSSECNVSALPIKEYDVMSPQVETTRSKNSITKGADFNFIKDLMAIRTPRRSIGQARSSGGRMVKSRLHRIATDGKVFAKMDSQTQSNRRLEIIINVDMSGSTGGYVLSNELGAAYEMSKALRSARIAHTVIGHTADGTGEGPVVYRIYSFDMGKTDNNMDARFDRARSIELSNNYDGFILDYIQKFFTKRDATRYIINLSDGQPAGRSYTGEKACKHVQLVVANLLKRGINTISLSVVGDVVKANDKIYGKENNIDASKDVSGQFRKLMTKIAQG